LIFIYDHTDYVAFLQDLADRFSGTFDGETMHFPSNIAEGYLRIVSLPDGLQALLSDYTLHVDFTFFRIPRAPELFYFRADYFEASDGININMGEDKFTVSADIYTNIMIFSSKYNAKVSFQKGVKIKSISIILQQEWLDKYFPKKLLSFWLNHTHILRSNNVTNIPLDLSAREMLFSLLDLPKEQATYLFYVQTRILELIDYYFKQAAYLKNTLINSDALLEDIGRLTEMEVLSVESMVKTGIIPSIDVMAKQAGMSASKLKILFKKIYNQSIGDYFITCRLNIASNMLLKEKMNVKQVSTSLGYKSVQHFTTAFKKQFGKPPAALFKNKIP
jgi:AraC-like DNA-binding protein